MLAPVLAHLETIPGVTAARADSSGRFFSIALEAEADASSSLPLVLAVLGRGSRLLSAAEADAQLAAQGRGDPWLRAGEVMLLSFVESRMLAVRLATELARRTDATEEQREIVAEAIRLELFAAMERVHAEGGRSSSGWIYGEWPAISASVVARCAGSLGLELRRRLAELLPSMLTA